MTLAQRGLQIAMQLEYGPAGMFVNGVALEFSSFQYGIFANLVEL
jgi:hypothetical protein